MSIYLDNAATTPLDPEVFEAMKPFLLQDFGNPSSVHSHGRTVRSAIEISRKSIAEILNCTPGEIIFTSGGTEADNAILLGSIHTYKIKHVISSAIEHHAVIHTLELLAKERVVELHLVKLDEKGNVDYQDLERLLKTFPGALVSLMHANNEIGNLLDIHRVADLVNQHNGYFHSDAVQSIGHYRHDLKKLKIHGMVATAHKFHGPKGIGFMYINKDKKIQPFVHGGSQERNMRGGTENTFGIIGLAKAMDVAYRDLEDQITYIKGLKVKMIDLLNQNIPGVTFNGESGDVEKSLYTVLNVSFPESEENDMLLFNLDLEGISASGGSACSSGALAGSHVLSALYPGSKRGAVRFSFSKFTKPEEIEFTVDKLAQLFKVSV
ncbi:MAG TPA: cysteine desulfurase family protein [Cyclobacteriaceae bacterium]